MLWIQNYYAVGNNVFLTAFCAALPIFFLFWALGIQKMKGYIAIFFAWLLMILVTIAAFRIPLGITLSAAGYGALNGLPLCLLIFSTVLLYNLIIKSGNFEIIRFSISSISNDHRVQAILIGFCFSAFLEGTATQGAPVAIAAAMLIGLGFPVLPATVICLVGNTVPVPYGPVGMPTISIVNNAFRGVEGALPAVTGSIGGVMCIYTLIIPVFMLVVMCGWKAAKEIIPLCLVVSVSYLIPNFLITHYMGPELPSLLSSLISLVAAIVFLRFWKPATVWRFAGDSPLVPEDKGRYGAGKIAYAWTPFMLVTLFMVIWSLPAFKAFADRLPIKILIDKWPGLSGRVYMAAPIVSEPTIYDARFTFALLSSIGLALFLVCVLTTLIYKMKCSTFGQVLVSTFKQLKFALLTIILVLSIAHISNYSGISFSLGLAFAATGPFFVIFSPLIGFIGTFLTGSVTASGNIFGHLQRVTAEQLGLNPLITITASMVGAVMGKLVSPQSIAIGAAAAGLVGKEGMILSKTIKYALFLLGIGIVIMLLLTYIFPEYFPQLAGLKEA
jgi:lactate permease